MLSLAFIASLFRVTEENLLFEAGLSDPPSFFCMFSLIGIEHAFIFYLLSLQLMVCCVAVTKKQPRTSSIVQLIFYFGPLRSMEIF